MWTKSYVVKFILNNRVMYQVVNRPASCRMFTVVNVFKLTIMLLADGLSKCQLASRQRFITSMLPPTSLWILKIHSHHQWLATRIITLLNGIGTGISKTATRPMFIKWCYGLENYPIIRFIVSCNRIDNESELGFISLLCLWLEFIQHLWHQRG